MGIERWAEGHQLFLFAIGLMIAPWQSDLRAFCLKLPKGLRAARIAYLKSRCKTLNRYARNPNESLLDLLEQIAIMTFIFALAVGISVFHTVFHPGPAIKTASDFTIFYFGCELALGLGILLTILACCSAAWQHTYLNNRAPARARLFRRKLSRLRKAQKP